MGRLSYVCVVVCFLCFGTLCQNFIGMSPEFDQISWKSTRMWNWSTVKKKGITTTQPSLALGLSCGAAWRYCAVRRRTLSSIGRKRGLRGFDPAQHLGSTGQVPQMKSNLESAIYPDDSGKGSIRRDIRCAPTWSVSWAGCTGLYSDASAGPICIYIYIYIYTYMYTT